MPNIPPAPARFTPGFFSQGPYRGVLSEVARELGVGRSTVHSALYRRPQPRIVALVLEKIHAIDAVLAAAATTFGGRGGAE